MTSSLFYLARFGEKFQGNIRAKQNINAFSTPQIFAFTKLFLIIKIDYSITWIWNNKDKTYFWSQDVKPDVRNTYVDTEVKKTPQKWQMMKEKH